MCKGPFIGAAAMRLFSSAYMESGLLANLKDFPLRREAIFTMKHENCAAAHILEKRKCFGIL